MIIMCLALGSQETFEGSRICYAAIANSFKETGKNQQLATVLSNGNILTQRGIPNRKLKIDYDFNNEYKKKQQQYSS